LKSAPKEFKETHGIDSDNLSWEFADKTTRCFCCGEAIIKGELALMTNNNSGIHYICDRCSDEKINKALGIVQES
jgi:hypothetical protein